MYKPKKTESKLLIYQKYVDLIEYGYKLLIKYPKIEEKGTHKAVEQTQKYLQTSYVVESGLEASYVTYMPEVYKISMVRMW